MKTEFEFTLPTGYIDEQGQVHHQGVMRRSRAMDEILPMQDPRVQANPAYATVIILTRVIVRLGSITEVTPQVIETMFASDLGYLQMLYRHINSPNPLGADQPDQPGQPGKSLEPMDSNANTAINSLGEVPSSEALEKDLAPV